MRDNPIYAQLSEQMRTGSDEQLLADVKRFVDSFGDHDDECPAYNAVGREAELAACACGFARRHDLLDELRRRLAATASPAEPR